MTPKMLNDHGFNDATFQRRRGRGLVLLNVVVLLVMTTIDKCFCSKQQDVDLFRRSFLKKRYRSTPQLQVI